MNTQHNFLNVALAAMLMSVAASSPPGRGPRRLPPTADQPITLMELEYSCSVQGWPKCHEMASDLLNISHPLHHSISTCVVNNSALVPRSSPSASSNTLTGNAATSGDGSGDGILASNSPNSSSASATPPTSPADLRCLVSGDEKKRIRREVYCELLFDIDQAVRFMVQYLCLLRDFNCIVGYSNPGYLTPEQLITSIRLWHEEMIETHKKCCESDDDTSRIFSRDLDSLYGNRGRIGEIATCLLPTPTISWDSALSKIALLVYMLERMQELGRRRTCLRGCVSENQVFCTNLLPYLLI